MRWKQVQRILSQPHQYTSEEVQQAVGIEMSWTRRLLARCPALSQELCLAVTGILVPMLWSYFSRRFAYHSLSILDQLWNVEFGLIVLATIGLLAIGLWIRFSKGWLLALFVFLTVSSSIGIFWMEGQREYTKNQLVDLLGGKHWMAYDPVGFDPQANVFPPVESIEEDIKRLKEMGATGVITFGNAGTLQEIPRIATENGLKVILGLSVPDDFSFKPQDEFEKAIVANENGWVSGFCVGHVRGELIDFEILARWMTELRKATGKPVTYSAPISAYVGERSARAREIGDWYMPDVGGAWQLFNDPALAANQTRDDCLLASDLSHDKPVLLKMIAYPSAPAESGFSAEKQRDFFLRFWHSISFPSHVFPSYAFGFDRPFVSRVAVAFPDQRDVAGASLGIFKTGQGRPAKPVAAEFRRRWGLLSNAELPMPGNYRVERVKDEATGNVEFRLFSKEGAGESHLGSLIRTVDDAIVFRPHPDPDEVDGWGVSIYLTPFFGALGADAGGAEELDVVVNNRLLRISANGHSRVDGATKGQWSVECAIGYDRAKKQVVGKGVIEFRPNVPAGFEEDLSIVRISSNVLRNVKLDTGGVGHTGDSTGVTWSFVEDGVRKDHSFLPSENNDATYPSDETQKLEIFVHGNKNLAAGDGPRSKRTPHLRMRVETPTNKIAFGAQYDSLKNSFEHDNFSVTPLVHVGSADASNQKFFISFESRPSS